jgi:hypothetical protein
MMMSEDGDDEAVISFDEDFDDEMAELFSFGATVSPTKKSAEKVDYSAAMASVMPLPVDKDDDGSSSEDSFIELLEERKEITVVDASAARRNKKGNNDDQEADEFDDSNMQEMLDWLDEEDEKQVEEEELVFVKPPKPPSLEDSIPKPPRAPTPPPHFDTLEQAVKSPKSTLGQIRTLMEQEKFNVAASVRPHLWCRVVCGKTLEETLQSSVADSFQQWEQHWQEQDSTNDEQDKQQLEWIHKESAALSDRIVTVLKGDPELCQRALSAILTNHYSTGKRAVHEDDDDDPTHDLQDPLLPPVACAILSAGVPKVAAAVMLSHIVPQFMPILALTLKEREQAAFVLHRQFYLLACYHLPLLVLHLNRHLPDWYKWPTDGLLPQSYLISHLAGECGGAFMNPRWLLCLWDLILTSSNNSLRFFLVMSILETNSDQLLLLTGDGLNDELKRVMSFQQDTTDDGFAIEAEDETTTKQANQWVHEWTDKAQALWEETPSSVVRMLKHLEDEAVTEALTKRQQEAEERLKLKLEAQARAHQEAMETERERKSDAARLRLTRARLVAFYRQYNPGKENNIDKIMKTYEGRYEVLDAKLKQKYGLGFNPAIRSKPLVPNKNTNKLLATMNTGFGAHRTQKIGGKRKDEGTAINEEEPGTPKQVVVEVAASEVLPIICWSKEANQAKMSKIKKGSKMEQTDDRRIPLKFYLIDSRPEAAALDQGRFPTSVSLSPETLLDPDRLKDQEDMFESLRGTVHICIMGEGYSALQRLFGHKMTNGLAEFIKEDEARNNNCALFFLKKGFPFVSILDGGFAAAHSFLCREGPKLHLRVNNVLTDYNPEVSLFGQFEKVHNGSGRDKAQHALQNLFDSSMMALTKNTMRFESLASEIGSSPGGDEHLPKVGQNVVSRFFGSSEQTSKDDSTKSASEQSGYGKSAQNQSTSGAFLNPFARKPQASRDSQKKLVREQSDDSLEVESVDFDKPQSEPSNSAGDQASTSSPAHRQAPNTFSIFKQGSAGAVQDSSKERKAEPKATAAEPPKASPFSGFGAALNNSLKSSKAPAPSTQNPPARARNPFALFGMNNLGNTQTSEKDDNKGAGVANRFVGFSQLRKNTMARMRTGGSEQVEESKQVESNDTVMEESVSLDQSSPAIAPNQSDSEQAASEESQSPDPSPQAGGATMTAESNVPENIEPTAEEETNPSDVASDQTPKQVEVARV